MWEKLQKFGLEYSDLSTMIWNINVLLRILTLNVDSRTRTPIPLPCYLILAICIACYYYAYQFSMLWFVFKRSPETGDLVAAMVYGSLGVSSQISPTKLIYMLTHSSNVRCLVDQCLKSDAFTKPESRFSKSMTNFLRKVKIRAISIWICLNINSLLYVITPVFMSGRHLPEDLLVFYGLEPMFETPNYQISYTIMFLCVSYICYITGTIAAFVIIIIGYTEAQMMSLSKEMLCLWEDSVDDIIAFKIDYICNITESKVAVFDDEVNKKINISIRKRLIQIVQNHSQNVAILKNINQFFMVPNAGALGCLGISLIAELLGGLENTFLQIPFTFVQVAIDCFTGQKIMDASLAFERAVYSCKWENFDKDNRKIVLLMLQNSQKTLTMSAGGMAVLNFSCLMSIIRLVYSAYTTLRSII